MNLTSGILGFGLLLATRPLSAAWAAQVPLDDPLRLDPRVRPIAQYLELHLDPAADSYPGVARVELQFGVATNQFRFHARGIALGTATLDGKELTLASREAGLMSATAAAPFPVGLHVLQIAFTNDFNRDGTGLFKAFSGDKPYLFTHMEPTEARSAFPCWDEPGFKIPWRLTLTIPKNLDAVGNMPIAQETESDAGKTLEFDRTPPMSSYLVALAVGSFDFVPIRGQAVPGRIVTVTGQAPLAQMAAEAVPPLLAELERYFGLPCPYPKLDHRNGPRNLDQQRR